MALPKRIRRKGNLEAATLTRSRAGMLTTHSSWLAMGGGESFQGGWTLRFTNGFPRASPLKPGVSEDTTKGWSKRKELGQA